MPSKPTTTGQKENALLEHQATPYHKDAYTLWLDFKRGLEDMSSIDQVLSTTRQNLIDDNR